MRQMSMEVEQSETSQMAQEQDVVVNVPDPFVTKFNNRLAIAGGPLEELPITIFRVPARIREAHKTLFEPSVVSIGPYHRGNKTLQAMEDLKWRYLNTMLSRNHAVSLGDCIEKMKSMETQTRKCYAENIGLNSDEFVEMMLLDGCFILETVCILNSFKLHCCRSRPTFLMGLVRADLLMVENQIPYFVLKCLFDLLIAEDIKCPFQMFLSSLGMDGTEPPSLPEDGWVHHLLHWHYLCSLQSRNLNNNDRIRPNQPFSYIAARALISWYRSLHSLLVERTQERTQGLLDGSTSAYEWFNSDESAFSFVIPCATELQEAGVKLKRKKDAKHMFDITFHNGTLEIPRSSLFPGTIPLYMNLVPFEQFSYSDVNERTISAFAIFLDCIINTAKDVGILHQLGIIQNYVGSDEQAADLCNQFSVFNFFVFGHRHKYSDLFRDINVYCKSDRNRWRAYLMRNYFSNPWAALSVGAALFLLILTVLQTFFAMYAYFRPPS